MEVNIVSFLNFEGFESRDKNSKLQIFFDNEIDQRAKYPLLFMSTEYEETKDYTIAL